MYRARVLTKPCLWIALLVIVWASLAPSLAHAVNTWHGAKKITIDYCTMDGAASMSIDVPADDASHDSHADAQHCPFCRNSQAMVGIFPAPVLVLPAVESRISYPPLFYQAARPLYAWSAAQPRAPPDA